MKRKLIIEVDYGVGYTMSAEIPTRIRVIERYLNKEHLLDRITGHFTPAHFKDRQEFIRHQAQTMLDEVMRFVEKEVGK